MHSTNVRRHIPIMASLMLLFAFWLMSSPVANALAVAGLPWRVVSSATPGTEAILYGVSTLSTTLGDAWAVGNYTSKAGQVKTLIERWDGSSFKVVSSPSVANTPNILRSVSVLSANAAWAVGDTGSIEGTQTLTEHWNGTSWQIVPSPNPGFYNYLNAVTVVSANNAWAVGRWDTEQGVVSTLIEHWNGSNWQVVPSPNVTGFNELYAVTAISGKNVWAVGSYLTFRGDGAAINQTLTEHWNGTRWQVVPSPSVVNLSNTITGMTAVSSSNIWIVGNLYDPTAGPAGILIEHWNGTQWKMVSSPALPAEGGLGSVAAVSSNDIWAVGSYTNNVGQTATLIAHWNGTQWKMVSSPNPGSYNILWAVAADKTGRAVAVGVYTVNFGPGRTLVEVHNA